MLERPPNSEGVLTFYLAAAADDASPWDRKGFGAAMKGRRRIFSLRHLRQQMSH
jgi:hypothetical protein